MIEAAAGARVGRVIGGVVLQAVRDAGASGIVVLDDGSPEARLATAWCASALGPEAVTRVGRPLPAAVAALADALGAGPATLDPDRVAAEVHRLLGRLEATARDALVAHPANKTALLLGGSIPPEPLLPLGDLYASQVEALAGGWAAPPAVRDLAGLAGGITRLDSALARWAEGREPVAAAFAALDRKVADLATHALDSGRHARRHVGLVPKLGARTLGIDLFG